MKFLCVSDQIDPLIYSTLAKERYSDVDAVLCAGDLSMEYVDFIVSAIGKPTYFVFGNHNLEEFSLYEAAEDSQNSRSIERMQTGHGADYLSGKVLRPKFLSFTMPSGKKTPLLIAGVSGSIRYNNGKCQYTESQMKRKLIRMIPSLIWNKIRYGRYLDILLTHASPRHVHDKEDNCHKGFECFNWFIKKFRPALLVHGHIHLYDLQEVRVTKVEDTTVVNAYSHIVVEMKMEMSQEDNRKGENFATDISICNDR